nr:toll/interleukin-1 receptor domain-containing protein [Candidatus Sigynarchaeota archaeon]
MGNSDDFMAIVLGMESMHNLRLSEILRKALGKNNVLRFLESQHLLECLAEGISRPAGIFFDLSSFSPEHSTETIGYIRNQYPTVVFCIYMSNEEENDIWPRLPANWQNRLDHYYRLFKESEDTELEPIVRRTLFAIIREAKYNMTGTPIRITDPNDGGVVSLPPHATKNPEQKMKDSIFISYSRQDWESFVSPFTNRLHDLRFPVWIDQHLLIGGDDWMDAIGEALDMCKMLLLIMSPDALESKYVKMEYRYFFNHDKFMIPILYKAVKRIPPELATMQYIDFSTRNDSKAFSELANIIKTRIPSRPG